MSACASTHSDQGLRCPHKETLGPQLHIERMRRLCLDWTDAQADLSLRWAHTPFCWFCHEVAQLFNNSPVQSDHRHLFNLFIESISMHRPKG